MPLADQLNAGIVHGVINNKQLDAPSREKGGIRDSGPPSNNAPTGSPVARSRDRAAAWRADMAKAASYLYQRTTTPEQHAEIDATYQEALAEGPDFARYHRGSEFRNPPRVNTDRNHLARLMFMADTIERKSWAVRAKGKHGGALGRSALAVFRVLLFVVTKREGCLYPSLETLARLARMSKPTVVTAIARLVLMGFLTVYRRIKRIRTPLGIRVVQDSNCYEYHPPTGLGALGWAIWRSPSESNKSPARTGIDSERSGRQEIERVIRRYPLSNRAG
jgi:DNA-binding MarR family transcriptional regulator